MRHLCREKICTNEGKAEAKFPPPKRRERGVQNESCLYDLFRRLRQFSRLVLPAPEGPMMANICSVNITA